ncbi:Fic family protein [Actinotalea sp. Marseille-Q4924]|uniref:Fic family protein n=1 Tax=Actinotalea sp. Marseille-Q4924 TaxID=2866571 RepID=UPI001CE40E42|nr:Fic family protein [Actinotalea sp. Marseille-Q4924]
MPAPHPLTGLAMLPVGDEVEAARRACEELRWHRALRRQWAVARAEAGVRAAHAGAVLEGVRVPLEHVRDLARGAGTAPDGAAGTVLLGAVRAQAVVEGLMAAPGSTARRAPVPFRQLLARLHVAVVGGAAGGAGEHGRRPGGAVGRPRRGEPLDLRGLGPAPAPEEVDARLDVLAAVVDAASSPAVPGVVLAAVAHGELLALRPFEHGNGLVARAVFRHLLVREGVDAVGVVVPEVRWVAEPLPYVATAARFATGTADGVAAWVRWCAGSVVRGAEEGTALADAVLAGRLDRGRAGAGGART